MQKLLKRDNIYLRKANNRDIRFLFNIFNENIKKKNFFSKKKLKYSDHKIWFKKNMSKNLLFICVKKYKIGYIRYDKFKNKDFKVSIAIKETHKNKGFGKILLKRSLGMIKSKNFKIYAFIRKTNKVSKRFFLSCKFKLTAPNIYVLKYKNEKIHQ